MNCVIRTCLNFRLTLNLLPHYLVKLEMLSVQLLLIVKAVVVVLILVVVVALLLYEPVWMNLNCLAWSWLRPSVVIYRFLPVAGHT